MRYFIYLCACLMFSKCTEPVLINNTLAGKLKTLQIIYPDGNDTTLLNYVYDNAGYLVALESDSLNLSIGSNVNNQIMITVSSLDSDPMFNSTQKYIAYVDIGDKILNIVKLDTITSGEAEHIRAVYKSDALDTLSVKGDMLISNVLNYNYKYEGNNYIIQYASWYVWDFVLHNVPYFDTTIYTYTTLLNEDCIPLQIPYFHVAYGISGQREDDMLLYVLDVNGYRAFDRNKNLIQSVSSFVRSFAFPVLNKNYLTNYTYVQNEAGQVVEMRVSNSDGTGVFMVYKMTYY